MHIFLYEWITGGGLVEERSALSGSLLTEGLAMVQALAADCAAIPGARVSLLRDFRLPQLTARGCEAITVCSLSEHHEAFDDLAARADATIIIAPEFDGELVKLIRRAKSVGARFASPDDTFARLASNKHETAERLRAAGVPTPHGLLLEGDTKLPADFRYPAVLKPVDGAGSQDVYLVAGPEENPPAYVAERRLEEFAPGLPASVALLCGGPAPVALAPCTQEISTDGRLRYLGGRTPLASGLAERAISLATRAAQALPSTIGYIGVDLVLGSDPTGAADVVIEVNPRLTTSYVGLRASATTNLAAAMLAAVQGEQPLVEFRDRPLEFDAAGNVSFVRE
jgi:tyramine---L-glutamate ligase